MFSNKGIFGYELSLHACRFQKGRGLNAGLCLNPAIDDSVKEVVLFWQ